MQIPRYVASNTFSSYSGIALQIRLSSEYVQHLVTQAGGVYDPESPNIELKAFVSSHIYSIVEAQMVVEAPTDYTSDWVKFELSFLQSEKPNGVTVGPNNCIYLLSEVGENLHIDLYSDTVGYCGAIIQIVDK